MAIDLVIVGAGGFGREALDVIEALAGVGHEEFHVIGVADDLPSPANVSRLAARGYRHLGGVEDVINDGVADRYLVCVGSPAVRARLVAQFDRAGWRSVSVIHPSATLGSETRLGTGVVICAGVQVSTNVHIRDHVHLNPNVTVGHDTEVGDFVSVNPGAILSGDVVVGRGSLIGAGAVVLQGLSVGDDATVGAAACVTKDVPPGTVVKGVPAR